MIISVKCTIWMAAIAGSLVLTPVAAKAQWWSRGPADFEDCADAAEKAATKEAKASALAECSAKFAGRRKPGGGYSYFDFMQNRHFDIAGPNPTPEEQKQIDEQYIAYLEDQRRSAITAAFTARRQEVQQASYRTETEKIPVPVERPKAAVTDLRSRSKFTSCAKHAFSCEWPRLSEGIQDIKKALFGPSQGKAKRS